MTLRPVTTLHYQSLLQRALSTPWAIEREKLHDIVEFLSAKAAGDLVADAQFFEEEAAAHEPTTRGTTRIIPMHGTIAMRGSRMARSSGLVSAEAVGQELDHAAADRTVGQIILDIDSPGGAVVGIEELAAKVRAATESKRVIAYANATVASAAYWVATQADEIVATPSARLGSIGVIGMHQDMSGALQKRGVAVTIIKAGKHKGEGNPFGPLSDEDRDAFQARVDHAYEQFIDAVAQGRGVKADDVRNGFGQGRIVLAREAVRLGMADRIATYEELLSPGGGAKQGTRLAAQSRAEFLKGLAAEIRDTTEALR